MNSLDLVRLALSRLRSNRLRAVLTMLGVIIGVASVVSLVAVGDGTTRGITTQLQSLGTNLLTINPGRAISGANAGEPGSSTSLTLADAAAVGQIPGVVAVAPEIATTLPAIAGTKNTTTTIVGTTPSYALVRNQSVWLGSFLSPVTQSLSLRVAVVGATTATNLGLGANSVGTDIKIGGIPFRVIGILQPKGGSSALNQDDQIVVPLSTVRSEFVGGISVRTIGVSVASVGQMDAVTAAITTMLQGRHGILPGHPLDFAIANQAQLLGAVSSVSTLLAVLLAGIASISLVVGGIGIMNIMLVSVRERTREIGIRKAIGARSRDILLQFLIEALTLSVLGGAIGIVLGLVISAVIGQIAGWGFVFSPLILIVAAAFSAVVGVVFGVWPARQAALLDPIAALRYE
ncbi:MAG: ABC transporter permease [Chloroflexi bacterium]|nr:ABC transporter permease [Chloroflexota bacterium]